MSLATAMVIAVAVPSRASAPGPYSGFAQGEVAHLDALTFGGTTTTNGTRLADVEVGQATAAVSSEGLPKLYNEYARPIVPKDFAGKNSYGQASILEAGLGTDPDTANQIAPFVTQAATSGSPTHVTKDDDALTIPGSPIVWADLLHNTAVANWNPDTCIIGEPISAGQTTAADAQAVDLGASDNANGSFKQALARVTAVHTDSFEQLFAGKGDGLGLMSVAQSNAIHVALFDGDPANEVDIDVAPAELVVTADGTPGGAHVAYDAPIAKISAGGSVIKILTDITGPVDVQIPPGAGDSGSDMLLRLKLGTLLPLASSTGPNIKTLKKADGTAASGSVNVLEVTLLDVPEVPLRGLTLGVGHLEAAAQVPAGGIDCPIPVTKTPSQSTVQSGDTFTTTIKIDNPFVCPLENVSLEDVITSNGAATFQVLSANPDADSPSLPTGSGTGPVTVKWNNLGTIAPGASKSVVVTLKAGGGAGQIKDTATAAGSVANCKPAPGSSSSTVVTGITKVKVPVTGTGTLTVPETTVLGVTKLPRTGLSDGTLTIVGMLMLLTAATGGSVLRRRRHSNA